MKVHNRKVGAGIAIGVALAGAANAQRAPLSIEALDAVVAGSQQPATTDTASSDPGVIVAGADVALTLQRSVVLHDEAQSQGAALNIVNGADADTVNAVNVVHGSGSFGGGQTNRIDQSIYRTDHTDAIERSGANRTLLVSNQGSVAWTTNSSSFNQHVLSTRTSTSRVDAFNTGVPEYNPFQNLNFTVGSPQLPPVTVPRFGFDLTTTDDAGGIYGIRGSLGPFKFGPPQIVLGTVSLSGNDIVIKGGFVQLPSLNLGSAKIDLCVVDCGGVSVDLPTVNVPRIDFGAELRIPNANPFKDVHVNAGGGVAVAGSGHIAVSLGHVNVAAIASLDIPDLTTSFSFDVLDHRVTTPKFGVTIPPITADIELINSDVGVAYTADFHGALCVSIAATTCGILEHHEATDDEHLEVAHVNSSASKTSSSSLSSSGSEIATSGGRMVGADANVIAMSVGNANVDTESIVELDSQAQRGIKAFNAVNATAVMVGNALNVGAQRATGSSSSALSQSNQFSQFQTRPRGH